MSERQRFGSYQSVRKALMEEAPDAEWTYAAHASDFFLEDWDDISSTTIGREVDNTSEGTTEEMLERLECLMQVEMVNMK